MLHSSIVQLFGAFFRSLIDMFCNTELLNNFVAHENFYIKMLLHVSVIKPSSGSLLPCFAKVMIIKIIS